MRLTPSSTTRPVNLLVVAAAAVTICAFAVPSSIEAAAQAAGGSAAVRARVEEYRRAWNRHDASAVAAFFTEDADLVMGNLPARRGRQAIQDWWQDYFASQEPARHLTLDVGAVRFIANDAAVVNVATTTGGIDTEGQALPVRRSRGSWLLRRDRGNWLISALRGFPREQDTVVLNASVAAAEALKPRVRALVATYADAFNSHDASAVSEFYSSDADIIVRNAPLVHGRQAIEHWWNTYFSQSRPYRALFIIDGIREIAPDVALINFTATGAAAVPPPEGEPLSVRYTRATWVIVRESGEWLIAALWVLPSEDDRVVRRGGG
jgi:uncharacterized protein (TIGR02246 family)